MEQQEYKAAQDRTDAKLRYALVHLKELCGSERRGDDFERAHQESFLFHLLGALDAYLQELNLFHGCGLQLENVRRWNLVNALRDKGIQSRAFEKLTELEKDQESWLSHAKEMRDHSTHRQSVPRLYHVGGEKHGEVFLTDPRSGKPVEQDYLRMFEQWFVEMRSLIEELRSSN